MTNKEHWEANIKRQFDEELKRLEEELKDDDDYIDQLWVRTQLLKEQSND